MFCVVPCSVAKAAGGPAAAGAASTAGSSLQASAAKKTPAQVVHSTLKRGIADSLCMTNSKLWHGRRLWRCVCACVCGGGAGAGCDRSVVRRVCCVARVSVSPHDHALCIRRFALSKGSRCFGKDVCGSWLASRDLHGLTVPDCSQPAFRQRYFPAAQAIAAWVLHMSCKWNEHPAPEHSGCEDAVVRHSGTNGIMLAGVA